MVDGAASADAGGAAVSIKPNPIRFDPEVIEKVRAWTAEGLAQRKIGPLLGVSQFVVASIQNQNGIATKVKQPVREEMERGAVALREHFQTVKPIREVLALYREARRNPVVTLKGMATHARTLGLKRPPDALKTASLDGSKVSQAKAAAARAELLPRLQEVLNRVYTFAAAARELGICSTRVGKLARMGLLTVPPMPPRPPAAPKRKPAKMPRVPVFREMRARYAEPAPPKPVFQTVEAFLAGGGQIKRCPAAAAYVTTADLGDGRDVIARHAAVMAGDNGNWKSRAKKKPNAFQFGAAAE